LTNIWKRYRKTTKGSDVTEHGAGTVGLIMTYERATTRNNTVD